MGTNYSSHNACNVHRFQTPGPLLLCVNNTSTKWYRYCALKCQVAFSRSTTGEFQLAARVRNGQHRSQRRCRRSLHSTFSAGNIEAVYTRLALSGSQQLDMQRLGRRALLAAAGGSHLGVLQRLLALQGHHAVNISAASPDMLHSACSRGSLSVFEFLLGLPEDPWGGLTGAQCTPLLVAACSRYTSPKHQVGIGIAQAMLHLTGARAVDATGQDNAALIGACRSGNLAALHPLLALEGDWGIDVHAQADAGLMAACGGWQDDVVRELLALEGDRRIQPSVRDGPALKLACEHFDERVVRELLAAGASSPTRSAVLHTQLTHAVRNCPEVALELLRAEPCSATLELEALICATLGAAGAPCPPQEHPPVHPALAQAAAQHVLLFVLGQHAGPHRINMDTESTNAAASPLEFLCLAAALPALELGGGACSVPLHHQPQQPQMAWRGGAPGGIRGPVPDTSFVHALQRGGRRAILLRRAAGQAEQQGRPCTGSKEMQRSSRLHFSGGLR